MSWPTITVVLLVFACLVTYEYIRDLRRSLKEALSNQRTAWRLYDAAQRELCAVLGKHVPKPYFPEDQPREDEKPPSSAPFVPAGIGPTAINDREMRRSAEEKEKREPAFASKSVLTGRGPTRSDVAAAARRSVDGDSLD